MKLDKAYFSGLPSENLRIENKWQAHTIICKFYCARMTLGNHCPESCPTCLPVLKRLMDLRLARIPEAMLVYQCKSEAAKAKDIVKVFEQRVDRFGIRVEINPFEEILRSVQ
jgi:hypothetical protein